MVGYSWVDDHTLQTANQGHGAGLAGRRALLVIIGKPTPVPLSPFFISHFSIHATHLPRINYPFENKLTNHSSSLFFPFFHRFHSRIHHDALPPAQLCPSPVPPPSRQKHVRHRRPLRESGDEYRERGGCCRMGERGY